MPDSVNVGLDGLYVLPHPKAPIFSDKKQAKLYFTQLASELTSPNAHLNDKIRELIKQASLVSLYFYLTFIASHNGKYGDLTNALHLPMCNWRQSMACMARGARAAGFMPRSHFKSACWTTGADGWEILRNPNIEIGIYNSRIDKAEGFKAEIMNTFKFNELLAEVFGPDFIIKRSQGDLRVPAKHTGRNPNITVGSTGGASAGVHFDLWDCDDLIDEQDINSEHMSTVEMERKKSWFNMSKESLLVDWVSSRIFLKGTRYAMDDLYDDIWRDAYEIQGYPTPDIDIIPDGTWSVYYRRAIEDGESIFPERFPLERYEKMATSSDPNTIWTYQTQYLNDPKDSGLTEFNTLRVKECRVFMGVERPYVVVGSENFPTDKVHLSEMDIVAALDPAFTDKGISARTSKSAFTIWGVDFKRRYYLLYAKAGYYDPEKCKDVVFTGLRRFKGYVRKFVIERNGQQKMLEPIYKDEMKKRKFYIRLDMVPSTTDKTARIRTGLGSKLIAGVVYVANGQGTDFIDEMQSFPMSKYKMDVLDSSNKAIGELRVPSDPCVEEFYEDFNEINQYEEVESLTGY